MRIWCVFIFAFCSAYAEAQNISLFYKRYGIDEGLSDASCNDVFEDSRGFIWIGTQGGLNRFDGHRFLHFFHKPGDKSTLCFNTVMKISESTDGNIWIGTYGGGISCINKNDHHITNYRLKTEDAPDTRSNRITGIVHLPDGRIFASTEGGLFIKEPNDSTFFPAHFKINIAQSVANNACFILYHQDTKKIWIDFHHDLHCYDIDLNEVFSKANNPLQSPVFSKIYNPIILRNEPGKIYSTNRSGQIFSFDYINNTEELLCTALPSMNISAHMAFYSSTLKSWLVSSWDNPAFFLKEKTCEIDQTPFVNKYKGSVGDVRIRNLLTDRQGNEWLATGDGLYVRNANDVQKELVKFADDRLVINHVQENKTGVWLATPKGVYRSDQYPACSAFCDQPVSYLHQKNVYEMLVCVADGIEVWDTQNGSHHQVLSFADSTKFSYKKDQVQFIHHDQQGRLWIGCWSGNLTCVDTSGYKTLFHFSRKNKKNNWPTSGILSMYEGQGELLIGFNGGDGIWKWDEGSKTFSPYITTEQHSGLVAVIDDIYADDQKIYIGTHGGGLAMLRRSDGHMEFISRSDGLPGDFIYKILPRRDGTLWLVTNAGICSFHPQEKSLKILNSDFVQEIPLFSHSGTISSEDKIWFWLKENLYSINTSGELAQKMIPVITGFSVFGNPRMTNDVMTLNYDENFITISFSAFNFTHQERLEYSYMLSGVSDEWINNGIQSSINFSTLPDGEYTFQVRARYNGGVWSEPASIRMIIQPPFWRRWWFYVLIASIVIGIIYIIYRYRLSQILKMQHMRNRISSDLHDDVGASLSSINIFSKVAMQKLKDSPESTEKMLKQISQNATEMMDSMSDIVWSINPKNDTLNSLLNRIKQHSNEVLSSVEIEMHYDIVVEEQQQLNMMARKNIYLICKEGINNIAKHSQAKKAELKLRQDGHMLTLTISDNGHGMDIKSGKGGNGLSSMENRAQELGGTLKYETQANHGTKIILQLNIARISDISNHKHSSLL